MKRAIKSLFRYDKRNIFPFDPQKFKKILFSFRNAGLGSCSLVARIGGVLANTVGKLAEIHVAVPTTIFGVSALLSALFSLVLPETAGKKLPDTIEECEKEFKTPSRRTSKVGSRRSSSIPK